MKKKILISLLAFTAGFLINHFTNSSVFLERMYWKSKLGSVMIKISDQEKEISRLTNKLSEKDKYFLWLESKVRTDSLQLEIYKDSLKKIMSEYDNLSKAISNYLKIQKETGTILNEYLEKTGLDTILNKDSL